MSASIDSENGDPGFQIAPMVDVVFVLLLFFMAMAGMQQTTRELGLTLPGPHGKGDATPIVVDIAPTGEVLLNDAIIAGAADHELSDLRYWFVSYRLQFGHKDEVLIRPAATVEQERIVQVLNSLMVAGVKKVSFL